MAARHHPLQALTITFAQGIDGFRMLSVLNNYSEKGYVRFEDKLLALAILHTQDWDRNGRKLTMHFVAGGLWSEDGFMRLAEKGIERIEVAGSSPLNALQSGRQKKREEAFAQITSGVLTPLFLSEIEGWGLTTSSQQLTDHGLHSMCIDVSNGAEPAFSVVLDGWSGNIFTKSGRMLSHCSSYETAQNKIREIMMNYMGA